MTYAVIGLAVILALAALGAVVALLLSFREPRPFEPAVPNFVPDDWGGPSGEYVVRMPSSPRLRRRVVFQTVVTARSHNEAMDKATPILWAMQDEEARR